MAEERIDIQVTDKGADKAAKNLRQIATNAEQGATYVDRLRAALASLPANQLIGLSTASGTVANDLKGVSASIAKVEADLTRLQSTANGTASSLNTMASAQQRAASAMGAGAKNAQASVAQTNAAAAATAQHTAALNKNAASSKLAGHHQANLVAQLNDIGVSLAGGQNPFLVLIQQGSQLQDLSMRVDGGFKTLAASAFRMVAPFLAAAGVFAILYAEFRIWQKELDNEAGLKKYSESLGLTKKELEELKDVHITAGDVMRGVWDTIKEATNMDSALSTLKGAFVATIDFIWQMLKNFAFGMMALFSGSYKAIIAIWNNFPAAFRDIFAQAVNGAIALLENLANRAIDVLNSLGGQFEHVTLKRMENTNKGAAGRMGGEIADAYVGAFKQAEAGYNAFVKRAGQNTITRGRNRINKQAQDIIDDRPDRKGRKPKEDHTAENRAAALLKVNTQLDNELSRMRLLKDERAVQQRMDQIEESLLSKKIKLNDTEKASIRAKIQAIQDYAKVQQQSDRIMEEANGPAEVMNATVEAATTLYDAGRISLERYTAELQLATRRYEEATDPLYRMKEALGEQTRLLGKYGIELEKANYLEQIRQQYAERGLSIYDQTTGKLRSEVAELVAKNNALREAQFIQSQVAGVVDPIMNQQREIEAQAGVYAELKRMRDEDLLSEDAYHQAKHALWVKYNEANLNSTSDFFGALADVTKNGHGAVGAISKAAAIAQATIQGYLAVQKALASAPPPFNYVAAAAVAIKTGMNVAKIASTNVGAYKDGGSFIVGGRDGVDANNINMDVTKGERVTIETKAQQRANDNQQAGPNVTVAPKIVNVWDREQLLSELDTEDGEDLVMNILRRKRGDVNQVLGNG